MTSTSNAPPPDLAALALALYDGDYEWLNTQAQQAGLTLDAFVGQILDDLYAAGEATPPIDRPPKGNTVLHQLVRDVTDVFGDEVRDAARARAYDAASRCGSNGTTWVFVFQTAYIAELRRLLQPQ